MCEHVFVRWKNLEKGASTQGLLPGTGESVVRTFDAPEALGIRFHEVHARSAPEPGPEELEDAVPLDDQPVPWLHPCVRLIGLLLRPPDPHLPRPQRPRGLRARDRRQGQRPGARARRAPQAVMARRARRARHQHRSVPVGRGPLPADGGDLGGDARLRQPVLDPDQVAAAAARHRADARRSPSEPSSSPTSRSRRSTRRRGERPSRTRRIRASESRRSPSSGGRESRPGCLIAPLLPGINDSPAQVEELMGLLGEAGAGSVGGIGLHLRGEVRDIWFDWLRQYRPDLVSHYEQSVRKRRLHAKGRASATFEADRAPSDRDGFALERSSAERAQGTAVSEWKRFRGTAPTGRRPALERAGS